MLVKRLHCFATAFGYMASAVGRNFCTKEAVPVRTNRHWCAVGPSSLLPQIVSDSSTGHFFRIDNDRGGGAVSAQHGVAATLPTKSLRFIDHPVSFDG